MHTTSQSINRITRCGLLIAVCIVSQFFKNISPMITGPIINLCLIIATVQIGLLGGIAISIITPVTSFFISGAPAFPVMIPGIIAGNAVLCIVIFLFIYKKETKMRLLTGLILASFIKTLVLYVVVVKCLVPLAFDMAAVDAAKQTAMLPLLTYNFSVLQLVTALIAACVAFPILTALRKQS